jgi:methyl-accepting chemotaxis protein
VLLIAVFTFFIIFFVRRSIKPIHAALKMLDDMASGDLTKRITIKSQNEIGKFVRAFITTIDKIRVMIIQVEAEIAKLGGIGISLTESMQQTTSAVDEIGGNITRTNSEIARQDASVSDTNVAVGHVTQEIYALEKLIKTQAQGVEKSSSAIEEMIANVSSVTQILLNNSENVKELQEVSDIGRDSLQKVAQDIQEIARESEGLLEINTVMKNIASQTNLLSMNAAIEAAHAGDSGMGFAVVAGEIRKLAENSSEQSKTIGVVLKKIKSAIDKITISTNTVLDKFKAIDGCVNTVSAQSENIRCAMEEQQVGNKQVLEVITSLTEITNLVGEGSHKMLSVNNEITVKGKAVAEASASITENIKNIVSGSDKIIGAVKTVSELSAENKAVADELIDKMSKFKVEMRRAPDRKKAPPEGSRREKSEARASG